MSNAPLAPKAHQRLQLNWFHFKPEYTGRPDKDAEAHQPDQVLEPLQIEIELDIMSVGNMTNLHENVQLDK